MEPLHIGLFIGGTSGAGADEQAAADAPAETSWLELATAIKDTKRSIRCLWLRVKRREGDGSLVALRALGRGLVGATSIDSLVFEEAGLGTDQLACLRDYLTGNTTLRGIKFLRTHIDSSSPAVLTDFFVGNHSLKVLDLTSNPRVDDDTVREILGAILRNGACRLETLNIFEKEEAPPDVPGISESGVEFITTFVSRSK